MKTTTLVFGATGIQGNTIARSLLQEGYTVLAPVRSREKQAQLAQQGIQATVSDFTAKGLAPLVEQADAVVSLIPAVIPTESMLPFAREIIEAVQQAKPKRTLFHISSVIPDALLGLKGPDTRFRLRELAQQELPEATVTSTTLYAENFSTAYRQSIVEQGVILQAIPEDVPVAYLSMPDLASYLVAVLEDDTLKGQYLPLGGPETLTGPEVATKLATVLQREVHYQAISPEQLAQYLATLVGEPLAKQVAEMYAWEGTTGAPHLAPDSSALRNQLNLQLPSFEGWAAKAFE